MATSKSNDHQGKKSSWPELVGVKGEDAKKKVEEDNSCIKSVVIVTPPWAVTDDLRWDRVRLFVDEKGIVKKVPEIA